MSKLASGILVLAAFLLLALNVRLLGRVGSLEEKLDRLSSRNPAAPRLSPTATSDEPAPAASGEGSRPLPRPSRAAESRPEPSVESSGREPTPLILPSESTGYQTRRRPAAALPEIGDLTDAQKRAIAELQEARRKEELQLDGEDAARRRDLARRYESLLRACLDGQQQQRFDEQQRASAPRRDGPVTAGVQSYLERDPAPYDLEVEWHGEWWPARTVGAQGELTLIHYVGHGQEWHEWVPPERVRPHRP